MFKIQIKNLKVKTKIGVSLSERKKFQLLIITLNFSYQIPNNTNQDNIKFLKDYSVIIKYLKDFIIKSRYKTLEKLITESKKRLKKQFQLKSINLKIDKPSVAKKYGCDSISVEE